MLNLSINARDAMPDGGILTIETDCISIDSQDALRREVPVGEYVVLSVSDTGTGMTPDVVAKAFDPYFTTKPIGAGTGLGLSMIYGFVTQSGGHVRIRSEPGRGSTIIIYLPRFAGEIAEDSVLSEVQENLLTKRTILYVEDEPLVQMSVTDTLQDHGFDVIEAGEAHAALLVLQSDKKVDLLLTDVGLPGGMNGRQLADAGRDARAGLKVLFTTGYAVRSMQGSDMFDRGMQVLTKPFDMDVLVTRINDLIDDL